MAVHGMGCCCVPKDLKVHTACKPSPFRNSLSAKLQQPAAGVGQLEEAARAEPAAAQPYRRRPGVPAQCYLPSPTPPLEKRPSVLRHVQGF